MSPEGIFILRNQTKSLQIASFSPPSINAGCGGIDAYLGHFPLSIASKLRS
nr:conjugal transfer protein TraH [Providencia alcalifaciens]